MRISSKVLPLLLLISFAGTGIALPQNQQNHYDGGRGRNQRPNSYGAPVPTGVIHVQAQPQQGQVQAQQGAPWQQQQQSQSNQGNTITQAQNHRYEDPPQVNQGNGGSDRYYETPQANRQDQNQVFRAPHERWSMDRPFQPSPQLNSYKQGSYNGAGRTPSEGAPQDNTAVQPYQPQFQPQQRPQPYERELQNQAQPTPYVKPTQQRQQQQYNAGPAPTSASASIGQHQPNPQQAQYSQGGSSAHYQQQGQGPSYSFGSGSTYQNAPTQSYEIIPTSSFEVPPEQQQQQLTTQAQYEGPRNRPSPPQQGQQHAPPQGQGQSYGGNEPQLPVPQVAPYQQPQTPSAPNQQYQQGPPPNSSPAQSYGQPQPRPQPNQNTGSPKQKPGDLYGLPGRKPGEPISQYYGASGVKPPSNNRGTQTTQNTQQGYGAPQENQNGPPLRQQPATSTVTQRPGPAYGSVQQQQNQNHQPQYGSPFAASSEVQQSEPSQHYAPIEQNALALDQPEQQYGAQQQQPRQQCLPNDPARNKEFVKSFYQEVIGDKNFEAVYKYLTEGYINHNPRIGDGREVFKRTIMQFLANAPKIQIDFRRVGADEDLVWVHSKATNFMPYPEAIVDIFRIECGLIAEHWDVVQRIEDVPNGPNQHPYF